MAIPGYQEFMLPLLKLAADGREHSIAEALQVLAAEMGISREDQEDLLPSGTQTRYYNRVTWAATYLTKSELLKKAGRGRFRITQRGVGVLNQGLHRIDNVYLNQFPEFQTFKTTKREPKAGSSFADAKASIVPENSITPEEQLDAAYEELREAVVDELLLRVRNATPKFFEQLVVRLLVAMGYGGGQIDRASVTGKPGDEGIDGVIREDRLGLDLIYVQAKKWESSVGPGEIDKFVGSLGRKKANKGVFITSGEFTDGATRAGREAAVKVRLVDGEELANLMFDHDVGVANAESYVVKKIDTDFFEGIPL